MFNAGAGAVEVATATARGAQSPFSARERAGAADDPGVDAEEVVNAEESTVVVDMESKEKKSVCSAFSHFRATNKYCFSFTKMAMS